MFFHLHKHNTHEREPAALDLTTYTQHTLKIMIFRASLMLSMIAILFELAFFSLKVYMMIILEVIFVNLNPTVAAL